MSDRHVIGRLLVEIPAGNQVAAQAQQQAVGTWARSPTLWQRLAADLDKLAPDDVVISIPRLELSIRAGSETDFQQQLQQALVSAVAQFIRDYGGLPTSDATAPSGYDQPFAGVESVRARLMRLALYFLETGSLPVHTHSDERAAVAAWLTDLDAAENDPFAHLLRRSISTHPISWQRLVYAIGLEKVVRFVRAVAGLRVDEFEERRLPTDQLHPDARSAFWWVVLINSPLTRTDPARFWSMVDQQLTVATETNATGATNPLPEQLPMWATTDSRSELFFVQNAGLVLLAPFLPQLFTRCGWLTGDDFVDDNARHRAIQLLHYLATGETDGYEFDLTLNKVLCNQPLYRPVPRQMHLSANELTEADELLRAAISHWSVLKNTSLAGLRETFLQRAGKLSARDDGGWQLTIERKTVDILLDRLPPGWGYAVISLPWMPKLLFVEW